MYGVMAPGCAITYAVSGAVNVAQSSSMMLGAVHCYSLAQTPGLPVLLAISIPLALCAA